MSVVVSEISQMRGGGVVRKPRKKVSKEYQRRHAKLSRDRKAIKEKFREDVEIELLKFLDNPDMTREELQEKYDSLVEKAKEDIKNVK